MGLGALAAVAAPAHAADDGAYGRLDGDIELRASVGAALASDGSSFSGDAAALYLGTAGVYAQYCDALGRDNAAVTRSIAAGVYLQPLFLGRYASDLEHGPPRLDLLIDSFGLSVGAFWEEPQGLGLTDQPGVELAASLALPLLPDANATGLFLGLRGALRWRAADLARDDDLVEQRALISITLGWHHVVTGHVIDAGDRVVRARRSETWLARGWLPPPRPMPAGDAPAPRSPGGGL